MSSINPPFTLAYVWSAFSGASAIAEGVEALRKLGARRPILIVNRTVATGPRFAELVRLVSKSCDWSEGPSVFQDIRPHTPLSVVIDATAMLRAHRCDSVISMGAGSAIDAAKGVVLAVGAEVSSAADWQDRLGTHGFDDLGERWTGPAMHHLTIPTTLSSAAHTHAAGITIEGEKHLHIDPRLGPGLVAFDGELAIETPTLLWVSTGIKALDHAVESLYARGLAELLRPWRLEAFATIMKNLYGSASGGLEDQARAREKLLAAAAMSVAAWPSALLGLSHAIGHQAGAQWGMSHGTTSPIFLPAVMAFNAPAAEGAFELMADALDSPKCRSRNASETVIAAVGDLIHSLKLPRRLSEVNVVPVNLASFAPKVLRDPIMAGNPRNVTVRDVIEIVTSVA